MSNYAKEFLFLKAEVENCRINNPALAYRMACRLETWANHLIQSAMLPFPDRAA